MGFIAEEEALGINTGSAETKPGYYGGGGNWV